MKDSRRSAASLVADSFGSAPFNWTYSRAQEAEERALIAALGAGPGMRVLDVACGGTANTFFFADAVPGGEVVGIDRDPAHVAFAEMQKASWPTESARRVSFQVADAAELPPNLGGFDLVWLSQVVLFFPNPVAVLKTLVERHLAENGTLVVRGWLDSAEHYHDFPVAPLGDGLMARFRDAYNTAVKRRSPLRGRSKMGPPPGRIWSAPPCRSARRFVGKPRFTRQGRNFAADALDFPLPRERENPRHYEHC